MTDISISALGAREFRVEVRDQQRETAHHVTVPERLVDELGPGADELERLVRESFGFLLEREPASSILPRFSLDEISQYFPEYEEELRRRLA